MACVTRLVLALLSIWRISQQGVAFKISRTDSIVEETICQSKYLKARCPSDDQVILVERARYGRMTLSKCVRENFGYIGCSNDVLGIMDGHCSGKHSCTVRILDENFDSMRPCHEDLKSYLAVEYRCIKVLVSFNRTCSPGQPITVEGLRGYLASIVSLETGCGTSQAPWHVRVHPGQRIKLSLFDFSVTSQSHGVTSNDGLLLSRSCKVYGIVRELDHPTSSSSASTSGVTVCGGELRFRHVYLSQRNRLEIQIIIGNNPNKNFAFIFAYEAVGCPDVEAPPGGWIQRSGSTVTMGCTRSTETWYLYCKDLKWIGVMKNCTPDKLEIGREEAFHTTIILPSGLLVVVIIVVTLGIGIFVVVLGVACLTRCQSSVSDATDEEDHVFAAAEVVKSKSDKLTFAPRDTVVTYGVTGSSRVQTLKLQMKDFWMNGWKKDEAPSSEALETTPVTWSEKGQAINTPDSVITHSISAADLYSRSSVKRSRTHVGKNRRKVYNLNLRNVDCFNQSPASLKSCLSQSPGSLKSCLNQSPGSLKRILKHDKRLIVNKPSDENRNERMSAVLHFENSRKSLRNGLSSTL